jgi:hypothetical protein
VPGGTLNLYAANDATLNLAIPSGLGVTAAGTSTNTTAGVVSSGCKIYDGDGKDLEGSTLPNSSTIHAVKIDVSSTDESYLVFTDTLSNQLTLVPGNIVQIANSTTGGIYTGTMSFDPTTGPNDVTVILATSTT